MSAPTAPAHATAGGPDPERALRRLELTIVRRLDGLLHGHHQGLLPGPGSESGDSRVYVPGQDDVRRMDWPVTARTTLPHVRDLVADRELETWALADLSPSMDFGTAAMEKRDLVIAAIAAFGFLSARTGDRFGAHLLHGGHIRALPARTGRAATYALLRTLMDLPRGTPGDTHPPLAEAIETLGAAHRRRGLRVIVSDFLDLGEGGDPTARRPWEHPLRRLAARHQVLAVEVLDPRELELPAIGPVTLTDPETGATRDIHLTGRIRRDYATAAALHRQANQAALRRCRAGHLVLRTDRDWVYDIVRHTLGHRRTAHLAARHTRKGAGA